MPCFQKTEVLLSDSLEHTYWLQKWLSIPIYLYNFFLQLFSFAVLKTNQNFSFKFKDFRYIENVSHQYSLWTITSMDLKCHFNTRQETIELYSISHFPEWCKVTELNLFLGWLPCEETAWEKFGLTTLDVATLWKLQVSDGRWLSVRVLKLCWLEKGQAKSVMRLFIFW